MLLTDEQRVLLNRMAILDTWRHLIGPARSDALAAALADLDHAAAEIERLRAEATALRSEVAALGARIRRHEARARAWEHDPLGED
jgi:predicted  nucleic acid-binding Zn-ribbon protein